MNYAVSVKRYKIIVAYDGTEYAGWQIQVGQPTIAGVLQDTFRSVFHKDITILGASRTDAGVHALGQTAAFSTDLAMHTEQMMHAWQNRLPESILLRSLQEVSIDWNPRYPVKQKTYRYHFFTKRPSPFTARYGWYCHRPIDKEKLQQLLSFFVGTHDFRSFCTGTEYENTTRTIDHISFGYTKEWDAEYIEIKGPGFLRYMIRRIVGACIYVASRDKVKSAYVQTILDAKNPLHQLPTAPAKGLVLYEISYDI